MRSRWMIVSAMVVASGLAWVGAATNDASAPAAPTPVTLASPPAQPQADPYVGR